jgi:hypothetical protein
MWMSTLSGHRRTAGVVTAIAAAALAAGPALVAAPAYAADSQRVNFTGGSVLSMLVCKSEPSKARLTVPAESRVMFVNRLGLPATLRVDGRALVEVGPNQAAPMLFHYGPVSVSMTFSCGAGVVQQFSTATATATGGAQASAHGATAPPTAGPTHSPSPRTRSGSVGRSALAPAQPSMERTATGAPGTGTGASPSAAAAIPSAGGSPAAGRGGNAVAVEPLVTASGTPVDTASGLLALLAAVCAVGVTIAVTRAIVSKRTIQARYA